MVKLSASGVAQHNSVIAARLPHNHSNKEAFLSDTELETSTVSQASLYGSVESLVLEQLSLSEGQQVSAIDISSRSIQDRSCIIVCCRKLGQVSAVSIGAFLGVTLSIIAMPVLFTVLLGFYLKAIYNCISLYLNNDNASDFLVRGLLLLAFLPIVTPLFVPIILIAAGIKGGFEAHHYFFDKTDTPTQ